MRCAAACCSRSSPTIRAAGGAGRTRPAASARSRGRSRVPPSLEERRPAITPQLALRVALLGGFAFVLFGVVFFRLWFLQVLTGEDYVSQARENRVRKVRIEAPRGDIVDRNGRTLGRPRAAPVVRVGPSQRPASVLALAASSRAARAKVEGERLQAADRLRGLDRELGEDG